MAKTARIEVNDRNPVASLQGFLRQLLEQTAISGVMVAEHLPVNGAVMPALVTDPERLAEADPLAPVFPINASKVLSKLTRKPVGEKIAAVMRPCEIRAFVELVKLKQGSLDDVTLIGVDCYGAYGNIDYRRFAGLSAPQPTLSFYENLTSGRGTALDDFDISTFGTGLFGTILKASDYVRALRYLQSMSREIGRFFEKYDVLLTPVLNQPPVKIGALKPSASEQTQLKLIARTRQTWILDAMGIIKPLAAQTFEFIPWTPVFNVTGQPAMSVPLHWNDAGLPIGMHFVGKWGEEATLFRLAGQLEKARPWFDKAPAGY